MAEATAEAPEPRESRFMRLLKKSGGKLTPIRDKAKSGFIWLWSRAKTAVKKSGRGIKKAGVGTGHGIRWLAVGVVRSIAWVGLCASWLLRTGVNVVLSVVAAVVYLLMFLVTVLVTAILLGLGQVYGLWVKYVHGTLEWLTYARWREATLGIYLRARYESYSDKLRDKGERFTQWITSLIPDVEEEPEEPAPVKAVNDFGEDFEVDLVEYDDDPDVVVDNPFWSLLREKTKLSLTDKAHEVEDLDETDAVENRFPGAMAVGIDYTEEGTAVGTIGFGGDLMRVMGRWQDKNKEPFVNFDFTEHLDDPSLDDIIDGLAMEAKDAQERAYWTGRSEFLSAYRKSTNALENHGRVYSLIFRKYQTRQDRYPLKYLRAGYHDMVHEFQMGKELGKVSS